MPGSSPGDSDPSVGIGSNGTVYFGYQAADGHARIAVSHDHGETWVDGQDVGAQLGVQNVVFPAMVAGDDDRAAFTFLGSTTGGNYQDAATFTGDWHLYVATTIDGGQTWQTVDATPTDPVQRGSICTGGTTCGDDRNLLDFMDVTVDPQGRPLVGYADGCTGACARAGGAQNYDALATIARQTTGPRLFAAFDPKPDLTVAAPTAATKGNTATVSAVVTNRGEAAASGVTVAFTAGSSLLGTSAPVDLAPGQSQTVSVSVSGSKVKKGTTVTAVVDPAGTIAESDEGNNKAFRTV
ncbi:CARDB protein [Modestobacter sp. DSM 44400]|uniref:CARDB domain-containing protein n=1 Tax=Modestobacter sp. DSM 44400 TaxID=1550230 RepID=UPI000895FAF3|nr:CARDB domain-containing protein [Modestobacter sp. DSM 44400]SDY30054.1 CARDB protein [Modestobacter sp. DSM 44400]